MKIAYSMVILICLLSCLTQTKTKKPDTIAHIDTTLIKTKYLPVIKQISQLNDDTCSIHWYGGGLFLLCFEKNKVNFFFTPKCVYSYKMKLEKDKLIFFWDYNSDCDFDRGLKKSYGVNKKPVVNSPFAEFLLINDTTLQVKYYYPEWVNEINLHEKVIDTLFPTIFKIKQNKF